jgi:predicted alpha/beta-hydrolase family hydrolase
MPKANKRVTIALTHGAGAGLDSDFMQYFIEALRSRGLRLAPFEFPYMAQRRKDGKKRPPDRAAVLMQTWREHIAGIGPERCVIAGKSMGGRIGSDVAWEFEQAGTPVAGCIYLGYPFHAPGKPDKVRAEPLIKMKQTPSLLLQGERDPFGTRAEVKTYKLGKAVRQHWLADGEHSLIPRKSSGRTQEQNWDEAVNAICGFVQRVTSRSSTDP